MNEKPIIIVQGGQWGSEGKGMVAAALCIERDVKYAVRTGSVNAGHTVYHEGQMHKMQQIPIGWVNPETVLVIGAGAFIDPPILQTEIGLIALATGRSITEVTDRIKIDYRCGIHLIEHSMRSARSGRHHSMGATGKGCSESYIDKIKLRGRKDKGSPMFKDWLKDHTSDLWPELVDTEHFLNVAYDNGQQILIEGTQGSMLDIHLGPWPYTTHKQTGPAQWIMEAGLSPNLDYEICLCLRTYPIRVAGNSGPMPHEITWTTLATRINSLLADVGRPALVNADALRQWQNEQDLVKGEWAEDTPHRSREYIMSEFYAECFRRLTPDVRDELKKLFEFTTVTNKLRRVAEFDLVSAAASIRQSRPDYICLTFLNYLHPEVWNYTGLLHHSDAMKTAEEFAANLDTPVKYVTTGPKSEHFINIGVDQLGNR